MRNGRRFRARFAIASFDVQKTQRLHQAPAVYRQPPSVAFEDDPEAEIRRLNGRRVELERAGDA